VGFGLRVLGGELAIARLGPGDDVPAWASDAGDAALHAVVRTRSELSIVCDAARVSDAVRAEPGWRALEVGGPLDLGTCGVLAALLAPLADAGVPIFAVSTYDTDYVLVRSERLPEAVAALRAADHAVAGA
jgi:uncharacterized protein